MRTEFRPASFQILPTVIKNLLIINALVYLAQLTVDGIDPGSTLGTKIGLFSDTFALHTFQSPLFKPWQMITHIFMHGDLGHIFFNMYALWMFGSILENVWGPKRFITFYLVCGIGAALLHMTALYFETEPIIQEFKALSGEQQIIISDRFYKIIGSPTVGASGAVFGCLAAFGYLFPNTSLYLIFIPIPIKAKWFVIFYAAAELFMAVRNSAGDNVAHFAHLGGALVGFLLVFFWNRTNRKTFY